jgi:hypothetical protein
MEDFSHNMFSSRESEKLAARLPHRQHVDTVDTAECWLDIAAAASEFFYF